MCVISPMTGLGSDRWWAEFDLNIGRHVASQCPVCLSHLGTVSVFTVGGRDSPWVPGVCRSLVCGGGSRAEASLQGLIGL